MPETAATLIAGAMGQGYAGLSYRQCLMCLLVVYGGGATANTLSASAATEGYQSLSTRQLDQCLLDALQ
jgi:hypothetical protein